MSDFDKPSNASGIDWSQLKGALLVITVHGQEEGVKTVHGLADPIRADVLVVDGLLGGVMHADTLVFPKVLIGQLRPSIGKKVLGRLGQGEAKPGQSPPWKLEPFTDADVALAKAAVDKIGKTHTPAAAGGYPQDPPF